VVPGRGANRIGRVPAGDCSGQLLRVAPGGYPGHPLRQRSKYVTCVSGAILDVVVDIRVGSPSYGQWEGVCLDDTSRRAVYLSEGLGHAFTALSEEATVIYLCSTPYSPGREHGVHPLDPEIGIAWPADTAAVLSGKDAAAPTLEQARLAGLLPVYADCEAYLESLRQAEDVPNPAARRLPPVPGGPLVRQQLGEGAAARGGRCAAPPATRR
jgi:hypothetical protein